ncbi:3575ac65-4555-466e-a2b5-a124536e2e7d-CDS [Sclerotinia trifoliorum]|uniref:3575ac65-4555-466e-a2b5-a124536e2e7d-CDS n=1 Tax=Sclerotinia trifoliorum TaxID=28548 RepID=A0A8H2W2X5_9HELO|nr:3575ac65-4555-466e-a2b5-a124536e2e7d-CDS [Sclerotinia trifoliorum]
MAPYHGIITAGLRNNRRYAPNQLPIPPLHYKSPVKHLERVSPPVVLSFPKGHDVPMRSTELARNLPGIHHQARERGNPRVDFMEIFGDTFEHYDDPDKLSEAGRWICAVINSSEQMQYCSDPFGNRITDMKNPLCSRIDDVLFYGSIGNRQLENHAAQQILHLLQAISDILLEDRRLGVYDGFLFYEFIHTAIRLAPIISYVLGGAGVLILLRAVVLMCGHDIEIIKELIQTIPYRDQQSLLMHAQNYWDVENKELGRLVILIFAGKI